MSIEGVGLGQLLGPALVVIQVILSAVTDY